MWNCTGRRYRRHVADRKVLGSVTRCVSGFSSCAYLHLGLMSYFLRLSAVTLLGTVLESSSPSSKVYAHDVSAMEHRQQRARVAWRVLATVTTATPPWNVAQPCGGRSMCIQSCCRCSLTCISTGAARGNSAAFTRTSMGRRKSHGAVTCPWGGR